MYDANFKFPAVAQRIERQPEIKLQQVMRFGMFFFIIKNLAAKVALF